MHSKIYLKERVKNKEKHHAASEFYYPVYVNNHFALFTWAELQKAIERGNKNREDTVPRSNWFTRLVNAVFN